MIQEMLVIFACYNSTGCSQTSNVYFEKNPQVKEFAEVKGKQIKQMIGPTIVDVVGPMLHIVSGGTGTIRVTDHTSLQMNTKQISLNYGIPF